VRKRYRHLLRDRTRGRAGTGGIRALCDNGPVKDQGCSLGTHDPGGNWTCFGEPHSRTFHPSTDQPGPCGHAVDDSLLCPGANDRATAAMQCVLHAPIPIVRWTATDMAGLLVQ
jgi:hypothetical protein